MTIGMDDRYYGVVGNGETVALISPRLSVDWLCVPRPDSFPVFARALDPERGGGLALRWGWADGPVEEPEATWQRYRGRTNILETGARASGLEIAVIDYMPRGQRHLTRRITLTNGSGRTGEVVLGFSLTPVDSAAAPSDLADLVHAGFRGPVGGRLQPGESLETTLLLNYGEEPGEAAHHWQSTDPGDLAMEEQFWAGWLAPARPVASGDPALDEAYYRSLLALKLLCHDASGAILAAPTASFPAVPGGSDNWDYRYCWLRDGYFISRCLDAAGLHDESRKFYDLVLSFQQPDGRWHQTLYTVDGRNPREFTVADLQGPGGEKPIRFGNAASDQIQIDGEPNVLHGLWCHWQATGDTGYIGRHWTAIRMAADAVMETWQWPENGIWEIRERVDHWVYGKALSFAGLDAAAAMARALGHAAEAERWSGEAERIRVQVVVQGWCDERQAFLQTYDKRSPVDISVLALSLWNLLPATDPRLAATVKLIEQPVMLPTGPEDRAYSTDSPFWGLRAGGLNMDGAMARYDYGAVPFYLPTLWLARHHLRSGQRDRALELVRLCLRGTTSLGLMAEHFQPATGQQWGNFPQGFSHEEMALTLLELFGEPASCGEEQLLLAGSDALL